MRKRIFVVALVFLVVGLTALPRGWAQEPMRPMGGMKGGMAAPPGAPVIPAVAGYSEGRRILFIHTETSDPGVAKLLTDMMGGSPVLVVPALARAPKEMLARVYVFKNGPKEDGPMGPLGFQPDVFEAPPGDRGYRPLRRIVFLSWKKGAPARILKSAGEVENEMKRGNLTAEVSGVVVNMPFLTWPGGKR